mmetsp:Transcript_136019/g.290786  ORF Transcript_136019/g.290786 Transcript_136019/m.290786 type:complete len:336 (+) Transcript_136019:250-1257(+)
MERWPSSAPVRPSSTEMLRPPGCSRPKCCGDPSPPVLRTRKAPGPKEAAPSTAPPPSRRTSAGTSSSSSSAALAPGACWRRRNSTTRPCVVPSSAQRPKSAHSPSMPLSSAMDTAFSKRPWAPPLRSPLAVAPATRSRSSQASETFATPVAPRPGAASSDASEESEQAARRPPWRWSTRAWQVPPSSPCPPGHTTAASCRFSPKRAGQEASVNTALRGAAGCRSCRRSGPSPASPRISASKRTRPSVATKVRPLASQAKLRGTTPGWGHTTETSSRPPGCSAMSLKKLRPELRLRSECPPVASTGAACQPTGTYVPRIRLLHFTASETAATVQAA